MHLLASHYGLAFCVSEDLDVVCDMIDHAKQQEIDAKRWQEWLAFAPLGSLVSSMGGGKPVSYEDFLKRTPTKKEVDETVINDIKKHFNLLD